MVLAENTRRQVMCQKSSASSSRLSVSWSVIGDVLLCCCSLQLSKRPFKSMLCNTLVYGLEFDFTSQFSAYLIVCVCV